jgi:hypothetical protein
MTSDIILIIVIVIFSIFISYILVSLAYNDYNFKIKMFLEVIILGGIIYLLFLQNEKGGDININNQMIENMNQYLITLSPLIPMVDAEGNPITYPPS